MRTKIAIALFGLAALSASAQTNRPAANPWSGVRTNFTGWTIHSSSLRQADPQTFASWDGVLAALQSARTNGLQSFQVTQQQRGTNVVWVVRVGLK
jgi:hypothetical protein